MSWSGERAKTQLSSAAPLNPIRFTGGYLEDSGLYSLGVREYDSSVGRFTSTDPIQSFEGSQYAYANDSPTSLVDPSGWYAIAGDLWEFPTGQFLISTLATDSSPVSLLVAMFYASRRLTALDHPSLWIRRASSKPPSRI